MSLLMSLEPIFMEPKKVILNELDEVNTVIFFDRGTFDIGYDFNGVKRFPLRFKNCNVIGAYYLTFHKKSAFIY